MRVTHGKDCPALGKAAQKNDVETENTKLENTERQLAVRPKTNHQRNAVLIAESAFKLRTASCTLAQSKTTVSATVATALS